MNQLFPLPVYTFLKIANQSGGFSAKGLRNLPAWLIKTILLEPLRWLELGLHQKRIREHVMEKDPIFILGFYRSGTSFLHEFLSRDDRLGYHTVYQMIFPEVMLSSEKILSPAFEGICKVFNLRDPIHRTRLSFRYPGEEDGTMTTAINARGAQWGYFFPEIMESQFRKYVLFEDLPPSELEAWKQDFVYLLKKISLANKGRQLILKSPPNTARIKLLLSLFPRAKFVFIHRHPYDVYGSNKKFWKVTHKIYALGQTKTVDVNSIILKTYSQVMDRYLLEKGLVPEGQLVEVRYDALMQHPIENIQQIYQALQLGDFNYCRNKMMAFIERQKSFVRLNHDLPEEEKLMVAGQLGRYISHWGYPV
ncbi:sulfotransferase family protein [Flavihumibacter stibioxidans]|uniref:Sulfotransferase family protein n=1 Tax=Flavihumibacter stibioxidans TaxID=1834163 RepID=A0ABR7MAK8_9BACT|nr:sulfotransferase [Flavihumibacter stibioxidans]MBC6492046.1 hypothetical protein [Flavihumibacter stibioxidans]